jgi:hypothetical protein
MNNNRFFNFMVIVVLVVVAALTISQAAAGEHLVSNDSDGKPASNSPTSYCSTPGASLSAIHSSYDSRIGAWVIRTESDPTGVDGGLIQLLNDLRFCSE